MSSLFQAVEKEDMAYITESGGRPLQALSRKALLVAGYAGYTCDTPLVDPKGAREFFKRAHALPEIEYAYPPVNVPPAKDGFLCIARIVFEQKIEQAIEILRGVRDNGYEISRRIVGRQHDLSSVPRIKLLCARDNSRAVLEGIHV